MIDIKKIKIGELEFKCRFSGNDNDELVILLHGFPETSIMWERVMQKISEKGYFCAAPDMRGYSENACPSGKVQYHLSHLMEDVLKLADKLGKEKFHLIGHDWGAIIGWNTVFNNPDRILSWSALSVPHPRAFGKALKTDPIQKKKSSYIKLFLIPFLPEWRIRKNDFKGFRRLWKHCTPEVIEDYLQVFRRKRSLTAALNYYRANLGKGKRVDIGEITTPTLFIWGNRDLAVGEVAANGCPKYVTGDYNFLEVDGGHWLIQSNYDEVERALLSHLEKFDPKS